MMSWTEGLEASDGNDLDEQIINGLLLALKGYYVMSGLDVIQATDQEYVDVTTGSAWCETEKEEWTTVGDDVGPFSGCTSLYERYDLVTIDTAGLHIIAGTEQLITAGTAVPPGIPEDDVVLAIVKINTVTPVIATADIFDHRIFGNTLLASEVLDNEGKYFLIETIPLFSSTVPLESVDNLDTVTVKAFKYTSPYHGLEPTTDIKVEAVFELITEDGGSADLFVAFSSTSNLQDFNVDVDDTVYTAFVLENTKTSHPVDTETITVTFNGSIGKWAKVRGAWLNIYAKLT